MADIKKLLAQRRWTIPLLGAAVVVIAAYLLAMHFLFPYPELKRWIETQIKAAGLEARLDGLGPGPFLGVEARSVTIAPLGAPERKTELREVRARLSLLSVVTFRPRIALSAEAMGGTLGARWRLGNSPALELAWEGIDLGRAPLPPDVAAGGLRGRSTGTLDAELPVPGNPVFRLSGSLEATITDAKIGPGTMVGFPLPGVTLGTGQFKLTAKQGRVQVQTAKFDGGNLDASFAGTVDAPPGAAPASVEGNLTLRPKGRAAEDLAFLFAFFPGTRGSDGTYTARVGGRFGALVLSPVGTGR